MLSYSGEASTLVSFFSGPLGPTFYWLAGLCIWGLAMNVLPTHSAR